MNEKSETALQKQEEVENKFVQYHRQKHVKDMEMESEIVDLKFHLLKIAQSFGISNAPSDEHLTTLVAFLKRNFMWFSRQEISYAFELYALGELDCTKQHYQTLNVEFVAAVLKAYQLKRFQPLRDADKPKALPQGNQFGTPEKTQEEWDEAHYNTIKKYCDENKKIPLFAPYQEAFRHMERSKLIDMTNEQKNKYREKVIERERMRLTGSRIGWEEARSKLHELTDMEQVKIICRRELVEDYFRNYIEKERKRQQAKTNFKKK